MATLSTLLFDAYLANAKEHAKEICGTGIWVRKNAERKAVDDGVADREKGNPKIAQRQHVAGRHRLAAGEFLQIVLFELLAGQSQGELRAVQGRVAGAHKPGQRADVVLVPVGEDDAFEFVAILQNEIETRDDHVNTEQGVVGEHQAAVHDDHGIAGDQGHAVQPYFAEAAQGIEGHGGGQIHVRIS